MTEREYATLIYCHVFNVKDDSGDAYIQGIMKALDTLIQRERIALEKYYRHEKTLEQVGKEIGLTGVSAGRIVKKAIRKLRHPSVLRNISMSGVEADRDMYRQELKAANERIFELDRLAK